MIWSFFVLFLFPIFFYLVRFQSAALYVAFDFFQVYVVFVELGKSGVAVVPVFADERVPRSIEFGDERCMLFINDPVVTFALTDGI